MSKYNAGSPCPDGYEFVSGYYMPFRGSVESYCRKLKKFRRSPEEVEKKANEKLERTARRRLPGHLKDIRRAVENEDRESEGVFI